MAAWPWSVTAAGELLGERSLVHLHSYTLRLRAPLEHAYRTLPARDRRTPERANRTRPGANRIVDIRSAPGLLADEVCSRSDGQDDLIPKRLLVRRITCRATGSKTGA
jgi:hypothetical protein